MTRVHRFELFRIGRSPVDKSVTDSVCFTKKLRHIPIVVAKRGISVLVVSSSTALVNKDLKLCTFSRSQYARE